ncbi:alpha/beta hydrolase [Ancylobacter oerskovii]|uniref:Alpha/beta hydrolase n=1 Tax=Ancylobacter oerskovii TaxID=459519 RepID=A0ABW4YX64_9HYPH|nr:alpha/beta hydrolase [Ancylobacter oerskovii]MBS7542145.1 alpha/beta hydrolase [Ancylobacter oerskovii]
MSADAKRVFLNYDQQELDRAYDQSVWAPQMAQLEADDGLASAAVRKIMPPLTKQYGPAGSDVIDVFVPEGARAAPILVFIHGGAWTRNTREDASYPAPTFVGRGAAYLAPDFGSLKTVRLPQMVESCRAAVAWTIRNAGSFGGDPGRVFLAGHSSGAHLAACVLTTDWTAHGLPRDAVKGGFLVSGMYDLHPVLLSSRREYLHVTPEEVVEFSPIRHLDRISCPIGIASGDGDSPEFARQSDVFARALEGMGRLASRTVAVDANHFQVPGRLAQPDTDVSRAAFRLMGI